MKHKLFWGIIAGTILFLAPFLVLRVLALIFIIRLVSRAFKRKHYARYRYDYAYAYAADSYPSAIKDAHSSKDAGPFQSIRIE